MPASLGPEARLRGTVRRSSVCAFVPKFRQVSREIRRSMNNERTLRSKLPHSSFSEKRADGGRRERKWGGIAGICLMKNGKGPKQHSFQTFMLNKNLFLVVGSGPTIPFCAESPRDNLRAENGAIARSNIKLKLCCGGGGGGGDIRLALT